MNEEIVGNRLRHRAGGDKTPPVTQYTAKDFQLEVLGRLSELEVLTQTLDEFWRSEIKAVTSQRGFKFDSRALIALAAIALSITGYVIQDARNSAREDTEIESTKARVVRLEQIATTNTEGRIRTEAELQELREGQGEIKAMIQAHDSASRKAGRGK